MKPPVLATIALFVCTAIQPVGAALGGGKGRPGHQQEQAPKLTSDEAAEAARRKTGGRVLNVKPANGGYRVKVLTPKGEVLYVPVGFGRH